MKEISFREVRGLLEHHGWQLIRISGSHHIFGGEGRPIISIPVHKNRVKGVYLRQVEQAIKAVGREPDQTHS